ncbi:DUF4235 domain-containing protein [Bifidobacterium simiarum]|nr:DUF4235 domain-containing protein [Bifidobacterium simiarum]MBT1167297.1 DUF4235 domain-containing protein [Bifidobacterium simiarum]
MTDSRTNRQISSGASDVVRRLDAVNDKVTAKRKAFEADPDDAIDKIVKFTFPTITGFVASKLLETLWNRGGKHVAKQNPLTKALSGALFAGVSSAVGFLVSQAGEHGSQALVNRRHRRNGRS